MTFKELIATLPETAQVHDITLTGVPEFSGTTFSTAVKAPVGHLKQMMSITLLSQGVFIRFMATMYTPRLSLNNLIEAINDPQYTFAQRHFENRFVPFKISNRQDEIAVGMMNEQGELDADMMPDFEDIDDYMDGSYIYTDTLEWLQASLSEQLARPETLLSRKIKAQLNLQGAYDA